MSITDWFDKYERTAEHAVGILAWIWGGGTARAFLNGPEMPNVACFLVQKAKGNQSGVHFAAFTSDVEEVVVKMKECAKFGCRV